MPTPEKFLCLASAPIGVTTNYHAYVDLISLEETYAADNISRNSCAFQTNFSCAFLLQKREKKKYEILTGIKRMCTIIFGVDVILLSFVSVAPICRYCVGDGS